jgi:hypothetical protein
MAYSPEAYQRMRARLTPEQLEALRKKERERARRWYSKPENKKRHRASCDRWIARNPEKKRAESLRYRLRHPDRVAARCHAWYLANIEKKREYNRLYRERNK